MPPRNQNFTGEKKEFFCFKSKEPLLHYILCTNSKDNINRYLFYRNYIIIILKYHRA